MSTTDPRLILVALAAFGLVHSASGEGSELPDGTVTVSDDEVAIGFVDAGDTCDNLDDFDAACPFTGSTFFAAPIVFDLIPCHVSQPLGNDYLATLDCEADVPPCPWDFDGDNGVGFADLLQILSNWGPCPGAGG